MKIKFIFVRKYQPKLLELYITSTGGELLAAFRVMSAIERSIIPIFTVVDGNADSAAALIAICGKKRFITKRSYMLLHQLGSGSKGRYDDVKAEHYNDKNLMIKI